MKTEYCKLTDRNNQTLNNTVWGEGVTHIATGASSQLCTDGVIHVYDHPLKASFFNPIHANIINPILWDCTVSDVVDNDGTKIGAKTCTTVRRIPLPELTTEQQVRIAIY